MKRKDYRSSPEAREAFVAAVEAQALLGPIGPVKQGGGECANFWHAVAQRLGITDCAAKERARLWGMLDRAPRFPRPLPYAIRLAQRMVRRCGSATGG